VRGINYFKIPQLSTIALTTKNTCHGWLTTKNLQAV